MRRSLLLASLIAFALVLGACSSNDPPGSTPTPVPATASPAATGSSSPSTPTAAASTRATGQLGTSAGLATTARAPDFEALPGAKASFGKLGKSVYRIETPANWNGELLLWAHGYRGQGTEVTTENPPAALRRTLIEQGYAWAASSFSENGYTPGIGADDTLALKRLFEQQVGKPKRTYIAGASMGGNIVTLSLENFPGEYDGALAECGALGGEEIIDYIASWARAAEFAAGVKLPPSPSTSAQITGVLAQWAGLLGTPDAPTTKGRQFISIVKMTTGGPRPFFQEGFKEQYLVNFALLVADPELKSVPARAATNDNVSYAIELGLGLTAEAINAGIVRQKADPDARNAEKHPDAVPTSGKISVPLLTLHDTGDLFVPVSQEQSYKKKVAAAGKSDLLVQRLIRAGGHCKFSDQELTTAWNDLRAWVADKKKPAGDDVNGDLSDAGRQFTNPLRPGDPGGE